MLWSRSTRTKETGASHIFGGETSTTDSGMRHFVRPPKISERLIAPAGLAEEIQSAKDSGDILLKATASIPWEKFCAMFDKSDGWFSICELDELMKFYKVRFTHKTKQVYERVHMLHCKHWNTFDKELLEAFPDYINFILSEGTYVTPGSETVVDAEVREVNEQKALP